ncbi:hypothetical protein MNBD_ALPHA11-1840 [hydrothermal vent metagenome]|uniref:Uncharacterized protein n=1 Tax=hydrothermal vent metagenome TaxID=652676 RepID=A0A3B0UQF3_9ZZZZ
MRDDVLYPNQYHSLDIWQSRLKTIERPTDYGPFVCLMRCMVFVASRRRAENHLVFCKHAPVMQTSLLIPFHLRL